MNWLQELLPNGRPVVRLIDPSAILPSLASTCEQAFAAPYCSLIQYARTGIIPQGQSARRQYPAQLRLAGCAGSVPLPKDIWTAYHSRSRLKRYEDSGGKSHIRAIGCLHLTLWSDLAAPTHALFISVAP